MSCGSKLPKVIVETFRETHNCYCTLPHHYRHCLVIGSSIFVIVLVEWYLWHLDVVLIFWRLHYVYWIVWWWEFTEVGCSFMLEVPSKSKSTRLICTEGYDDEHVACIRHFVKSPCSVSHVYLYWMVPEKKKQNKKKITIMISFKLIMGYVTSLSWCRVTDGFSTV